MANTEVFSETTAFLFVIFIIFLIIYVVYLILSWYWISVEYMEENARYMKSISKSLDKLANKE